MLNWYKNLYVGETVKKKEEKLIRKIERGRKIPGVYVVTLASNERDQLDILSVSQMEGRKKRGISPMIAGLAGSYPEALELVEQMAADVFQATGGGDIRTYLITAEREGK